jgi:hypothetical protein
MLTVELYCDRCGEPIVPPTAKGDGYGDLVVRVPVCEVCTAVAVDEACAAVHADYDKGVAMTAMRTAQLRYDAKEAEPQLDDARVVWLHDLLSMLCDELTDSIQRTSDLRERISDIEEELRSV